LGRAGIFVITRSLGPRLGIERELRKYNPRAPIFYSSVQPESWIEGATGRTLDLRDPSVTSAAAFCGLANPGSFLASLSALGLRPVERIAFPDHTRYCKDVIAGLVDRHHALLTTQKDWINLGEGGPHGVFWLKIRTNIDDEESFLKTLA